MGENFKKRKKGGVDGVEVLGVTTDNASSSAHNIDRIHSRKKRRR